MLYVNYSSIKLEEKKILLSYYCVEVLIKPNANLFSDLCFTNFSPSVSALVTRSVYVCVLTL